MGTNRNARMVGALIVTVASLAFVVLSGAGTGWKAVAWGIMVMSAGMFLVDVAVASGFAERYSLERLTSSYTTRDVFLMAILIAAGGVFKGKWGEIRMFLEPFGPFASLIIAPGFYLWGTLGAYLVRKPLSGTISMVLGGVVEILLGNPYGLPVLLFNFWEGLGPDLGYTIFRFKKYNIWTSILGCLIGSIFGTLYSGFTAGFQFLGVWPLLLQRICGFVGAALGGVIGFYVAHGLERLGVIGTDQVIVEAEAV